jgi:hypothetical protein
VVLKQGEKVKKENIVVLLERDDRFNEVKIDEDGDIAFDYKDGHYYIMTDQSDEKYVRVFFPGFFKIEKKDVGAALSAANEATSKIKLAKIYVLKNIVNCSVELFSESEESFFILLDRIFSIIKDATLIFYKSLKQNNEK